MQTCAIVSQTKEGGRTFEAKVFQTQMFSHSYEFRSPACFPKGTVPFTVSWRRSAVGDSDTYLTARSFKCDVAHDGGGCTRLIKPRFPKWTVPFAVISDAIVNRWLRYQSVINDVKCNRRASNTYVKIAPYLVHFYIQASLIVVEIRIRF